jgi:hypothetical protein
LDGDVDLPIEHGPNFLPDTFRRISTVRPAEAREAVLVVLLL